jgi:hypothetical protein
MVSIKQERATRQSSDHLINARPNLNAWVRS